MSMTQPASFKRHIGYAVRQASWLVLILFAPIAFGDSAWLRVVPSADGVPIAFNIHGTGEPVLVLVHGWSCDARYWQRQVPVLANQYTVVTLDLAGHGHSGLARQRYTMATFGQDVNAVVSAIGAAKVVLIGHSMGGAVIAEAARQMPERVVGLIGVDTLENIEYAMTAAEHQAFVAQFATDFPAQTRQFVEQMIAADVDPALRDWILADMSAAPPEVGLSALRELSSQYVSGEAAAIFQAIPRPVISINGSLWPIDYAGNRRHMHSYEAIVLEGAGHFLMLARAEEFNRALLDVLTDLVAKPGADSAP